MEFIISIIIPNLIIIYYLYGSPESPRQKAGKRNSTKSFNDAFVLHLCHCIDFQNSQRKKRKC